MIKLLPYILFFKYLYILALEPASPGNQRCASCIGTLSFPLCDVNTERIYLLRWTADTGRGAERAWLLLHRPVAPPTEQLVASGERLGCGRHTDKHGADRLLRLNHQSGWQVVVNTSSALVLKRRRCLVVEATHGMRGGQKTSNLLCFVALTSFVSDDETRRAVTAPPCLGQAVTC